MKKHRKRRERPPGNRKHGPNFQDRSARPQGNGAEVEVLIERILPGGAGLAHDMDGRVLLVSLAVPGDRVRVRIERTRGRVSFASITEILSPGPTRIEPPCPYFGRCGGCDFQQLSYTAQLAAKQEIISDCLRRLARLQVAPDEIPITGSPLEWRYRSRAQWQYDGRSGRLGYFERGSHRVCDVTVCPVLAPALQETLESLRGRIGQGRLPEAVSEFQAVAGDFGAALSPPLGDEDSLEASRAIEGHSYRFSADGFFQINHELLPSLIAAATSDVRGANAVDLYCGVGLFTLPLARHFARVTGIESDCTAIEYARCNLLEAELSNVTFECARVGEYLDGHIDELGPADFLLLDPPRAGAEPEAIAGILALKPSSLTYVSCDPATLARDLHLLLDGGYHLDSIAAFDMFPQTHHVETVVKLGR